MLRERERAKRVRKEMMEMDGDKKKEKSVDGSK